MFRETEVISENLMDESLPANIYVACQNEISRLLLISFAYYALFSYFYALRYLMFAGGVDKSRQSLNGRGLKMHDKFTIDAFRVYCKSLR